MFDLQLQMMCGSGPELLLRLLTCGGEMLHNWVSDIFLGPNIRTTQRVRSDMGYPMSLGTSKTFVDILVNILNRYGLRQAPFVISEEGSAQQIRADVMEANGFLQVSGFCGPSSTIQTAEEFNKVLHASTRTMATMLYVYTVASVVQGAPALPLFAISHDNSKHSFTPQLIRLIWTWFWQVRREYCV